MAIFYDTHAHLDFPQFERELDALVGRAEAAGVARVVTIGTTLESSRRALELSERFSSVYAAVGVHPNDASEAPDDLKDQLRALASHPKAVAIGEIGLDYYRLPSRRDGGDPAEDAPIIERQLRIFREQLELAAELGLGCVIHQRECFDETLEAFAPFADRVQAVFHCFVSGAASARRALDLGSMVSFTGILTFKNADAVRESLAAAPTDRFMLETDAPFLAPSPHRGKRCEPAHVLHTAEAAAQVKGCSMEELSKATCENARRFFQKLR